MAMTSPPGGLLSFYSDIVVIAVIVFSQFVERKVDSATGGLLGLGFGWKCCHMIWEPSASSHPSTPFFNYHFEKWHETFMEGVIDGAFVVNQNIFSGVGAIQYCFLRQKVNLRQHEYL
jgi:hypothetical protein